MILIAATAAGLTMIRALSPARGLPRFSESPFLWTMLASQTYFINAASPLLAFWTAATFLLFWVPPREPRRRMFRRPEYLLCFAATTFNLLGFADTSASVAKTYLKHPSLYETDISRYGTLRFLTWAIFRHTLNTSNFTCPALLAVVWIGWGLAGMEKPRKDWLSQWSITLSLLWIGGYLWSLLIVLAFH